QEIVLEAVAPPSFAHLGCTQSAREAFPRQPPERAPAASLLSECTSDGGLVVANPDCGCPSFRLYTLKGCESDAACQTPEWDLVATPPTWWPCPVPHGGP